MILVSYDISDDKKRGRFNKYISKFGHRIQFSLYEIDNSERVLSNIESEIKNRFEKSFDQGDSIYILNLSKNCKVTRYGYAKNEESSFVIL